MTDRVLAFGQQHTHQLAQQPTRPGHVLTRRSAPQDRPGHPEAAGTPCQHQAPEPCFVHDANGETIEPGQAVTVCQCAAPDPCRKHPDDRPMLRRPPAWNAPHPNSPVGRARRRSEPGGVHLEVEVRERLPLHTDEDLARLAEFVAAEQARRAALRARDVSA